MATESEVSEVATEKPVREETGELSDGQCPGPLKLAKESSGNSTDDAALEVEEKVKPVALLNIARVEEGENMDFEALVKTPNHVILQDSSEGSKAVQSMGLGNLDHSEGDNFIESPSNVHVSSDKISKDLNVGLDEEKQFEIGKDMMKSDTSLQKDHVGKIEKKDESTETEHSSETKEKDTCDGTLVRQRSVEWSSENEKEEMVQHAKASELAFEEGIAGTGVEKSPLAVKDSDCLDLQKEKLDNEVIFIEDNHQTQTTACSKMEAVEINKEISNENTNSMCEEFETSESVMNPKYGTTIEKMEGKETGEVELREVVQQKGKDVPDNNFPALPVLEQTGPFQLGLQDHIVESTHPSAETEENASTEVPVGETSSEKGKNSDSGSEEHDVKCNSPEIVKEIHETNVNEPKNFEEIIDPRRKNEISVASIGSKYVTESDEAISLEKIEANTDSINPKTDVAGDISLLMEKAERISKQYPHVTSGKEALSELHTEENEKEKYVYSVSDKHITEPTSECNDIETKIDKNANYFWPNEEKVATEINEANNGANNENVEASTLNLGSAGERFPEDQTDKSEDQSDSVLEWPSIEAKEEIIKSGEEKEIAGKGFDFLSDKETLGDTTLQEHKGEMNMQFPGPHLEDDEYESVENESKGTEYGKEQIIQMIDLDNTSEVHESALTAEGSMKEKKLEGYSYVASEGIGHKILETVKDQDNVEQEREAKVQTYVRQLSALQGSPNEPVMDDICSYEPDKASDTDQKKNMSIGDMSTENTEAESSREENDMEKHFLAHVISIKQKHEGCCPLDDETQGKDNTSVQMWTKIEDEVEELPDSFSEAKNLESTDMCNIEDETITHGTLLKANAPNETFQTDVPEPRATCVGIEENESAPLIHLTEIENERDKQVSPTVYKDASGNMDEDNQNKSSTEIELYVQDISKKDKELDVEVHKSQGRHPCKDHRLEHGKKTSKAVDADRTSEEVTLQEDATAEFHEHLSSNKNREIITSGDDVLNEGTTIGAIKVETISSESLVEKCLLNEHQAATPEMIQEEDKDLDEVHDYDKKCESPQEPDSHAEESSKQIIANYEPSQTDTQEDADLTTIEASAREKLNEEAPRKNTEECKDTEHYEEGYLKAVMQGDGVDGQKLDNHIEPFSFGGEVAEGCTYADKEQLYKEIDSTKILETKTQEEEKEGGKLEEADEQIPDDQESSKLKDLGEEAKNACMKVEKGRNVIVLEQENEKTDVLNEENIIHEEHPEKSNALLPVTYESATRALEEATGVMQQEAPRSDTEEAVHETTSIHMTNKNRCENHEKSLAELQAVFGRTEENESASDIHLKEQDEHARGQETSSTVSKDAGGSTEEDIQNKECSEIELCGQHISKDDRELHVQEDEIATPDEHLSLNKNKEIITLIGGDALKEGTTDAMKFETSLSPLSTEEKCLLSEHQENEMLVTTAKMIQEEDQVHKDIDLCEVDSRANECKTLYVTDSQIKETSEKIGADHEPLQANTQDRRSMNIESSESEKMNRGASKSNTENYEYTVHNEAGNLKAVALSDKRDGPKLDNQHEPLSCGDDAADGDTHTKGEHIYEELECSQILETHTREEAREGDNLEEEADGYVPDFQESSKQENLNVKIKTAHIEREKGKEGIVPEQENKRTDDFKEGNITNEQHRDMNNALLTVTHESIEEMLEEVGNMQTKTPRFDIDDEATNIHLTIENSCENLEKSPARLQAATGRTEENESSYDTHLTEQVAHARDQEVISTASKNAGKNTNEDIQNKCCSETEICVHNISTNNREMDIQDGKTIMPNNHSQKDKEMITLVGDDVWKEGTSDTEVFETSSSPQSTEEKCLLNEHQENEKLVATDEMIQEESQCHKDNNLHQVDGKENDYDTQWESHFQARDSSNKLADHEPSQMDTKEDGSLTTMESPAREEMNEGDPKSNTEKYKDTVGYEDGNLNAVTQTSEGDGEPLSSGDEAAKGYIYTEKDHTCKELNSSKIQESNNQEEGKEGNKLEEEADEQTPANQESSKPKNLGEETKNVHMTKEKSQDVIVIEQENKGTNDLKEENTEHEEHPGNRNALIPVNRESVKKALEEVGIMQKEAPRSDTEEGICETTDIHMRIGTTCENHEKTPAELQATFGRAEENETTSDTLLKEKVELARDREVPSTLSKDAGGSTDEDTLDKGCSENELCTQYISKDDEDLDMQDDKIAAPHEHLSFNKNQEIITIVGDNILKQGTTDVKVEVSSSVQTTEENCLLNEHQENERLAATAEMIQEEEQLQKDMNLCEVDSQAKKCNTQRVSDSHVGESLEKIGVNNEPHQDDTQEDGRLTTIQSSEMENKNQETQESSSEKGEHIVDYEDGDLKATRSDEKDGQKLGNDRELLSFDDDAARDIYTEKEHIYEEPKCSKILETNTHEEERECDKLEATADEQTSDDQQSFKLENLIDETKDAHIKIEKSQDGIVAEEVNQRTNDFTEENITSKEHSDKSNVIFPVTHESVEETLEEVGIMKKEAPTSDTKEETNETTNTHTTSETEGENHENIPAEPQATFGKAEENEIASVTHQQVISLARNKPLNQGTSDAIECETSSSAQSTEEKCLNEHKENEKLAPTTEMIQEEDKFHKIKDLYEMDSQANTCKTLQESDSKTEESLKKMVADYEPSQDKGDDQKLDKHLEPLSFVDEAAGGGAYTEKEHIHEEPNCSNILETSTKEEEKEGDKLEEKADEQLPDDQEVVMSFKIENLNDETRNAKSQVVIVLEEENKSSDNLKEENIAYPDKSNVPLPVSHILVKKTLGEVGIAKKQASRSDTDDHDMATNKEGDLSITESSAREKMNQEAQSDSEECKETLDYEEGKLTAVQSDKGDYQKLGNHLEPLLVVEQAAEGTYAEKEHINNEKIPDDQESFKKENLSKETKNVKSQDVIVPEEENKRTDDLKEENIIYKEHPDKSNAPLPASHILVKETLGELGIMQKEASRSDAGLHEITTNKEDGNLSATGSLAREKMNQEAQPDTEECKDTVDYKEGNLEAIQSDKGDDQKLDNDLEQSSFVKEAAEWGIYTEKEHINKEPNCSNILETNTKEDEKEGDKLQEEADEQIRDDQERSKVGILSKETKNARSQDVIVPEENKRTNDFKEGNITYKEHIDKSTTPLPVSHIFVEQTLGEEDIIQKEASRSDTVDHDMTSNKEYGNISTSESSAMGKRNQEAQSDSEECKDILDCGEGNLKAAQSDKKDDQKLDNHLEPLRFIDEAAGGGAYTEKENINEEPNTKEEEKEGDKLEEKAYEQIPDDPEVSSKIQHLSEEIKNAESLDVIVLEEENKRPDDWKEEYITYQEHPDKSTAPLPVSHVLVKESLKQVGNMQKEASRSDTDDHDMAANKDNGNLSTTESSAREKVNQEAQSDTEECKDRVDYEDRSLKAVVQSDKGDDQKFDNHLEPLSSVEKAAGEGTYTEKEDINKKPNCSNILETNTKEEEKEGDKLEEKADKQIPDDQESSKIENLSEETKNAKSKDAIVPQEENKTTDGLNEENITYKEHMDNSNAPLPASHILVEEPVGEVGIMQKEASRFNNEEHNMTTNKGDGNLSTTEFSAREEIYQEAQSDTEECKDAVDYEDGNLKAVQSDKRDDQKLDNNLEPLSFVDEAAGGGAYTEKEHINEEPNCPNILETNTEEEERGGDNLEEEAEEQIPDDQESSKVENLSEETKSERSQDVIVLEENKRTDDLKEENITYEEHPDKSNDPLPVSHILVKEILGEVGIMQKETSRSETDDSDMTTNKESTKNDSISYNAKLDRGTLSSSDLEQNEHKEKDVEHIKETKKDDEHQERNIVVSLAAVSEMQVNDKIGDKKYQESSISEYELIRKTEEETCMQMLEASGATGTKIAEDAPDNVPQMEESGTKQPEISFAAMKELILATEKEHNKHVEQENFVKQEQSYQEEVRVSRNLEEVEADTRPSNETEKTSDYAELDKASETKMVHKSNIHDIAKDVPIIHKLTTTSMNTEVDQMNEATTFLCEDKMHEITKTRELIDDDVTRENEKSRGGLEWEPEDKNQEMAYETGVTTIKNSSLSPLRIFEEETVKKVDSQVEVQVHKNEETESSESPENQKSEDEGTTNKEASTSISEQNILEEEKASDLACKERQEIVVIHKVEEERARQENLYASVEQNLSTVLKEREMPAEDVNTDKETIKEEKASKNIDNRSIGDLLSEQGLKKYETEAKYEEQACGAKPKDIHKVVSFIPAVQGLEQTVDKESAKDTIIGTDSQSTKISSHEYQSNGQISEHGKIIYNVDPGEEVASVHLQGNQRTNESNISAMGRTENKEVEETKLEATVETEPVKNESSEDDEIQDKSDENQNDETIGSYEETKRNCEKSSRTEVSNVKTPSDDYANEEKGGLSSSQDRDDKNSCLDLSKSGQDIHPKTHREGIKDIKENILEKEENTEVHGLASISEVTEETFEDEEMREERLEEARNKQECEPTSSTTNEIPTGQAKESASAPAKHNTEATLDISNTSNLKDECSPGVQTTKDTMIDAGEGEHEAEASNSLLKEQRVENTSMQEVQESEEFLEPNPMSMSLSKMKEITKAKDEVSSMNLHLSSHTDAAKEIRSEEIDEEYVVSKENSISSESDDINGVEISDEAKDFKMTSANLSTTVIDTANAKEESSASFVTISLGEVMEQKGDRKEQVEDFSHTSNEETMQNINSNEDKESDSKPLEHNHEMMGSSKEMTEGDWDKVQNRSPTTELPADGTTSVEVSNKFEKSYDSPLEVPKDEDAKDRLFQDTLNSSTATEVVEEVLIYNEREIHEIDSDKSILSTNASFHEATEFDNKTVKQSPETFVSSEKVETKEARDEKTYRKVHVLTTSEVSNDETKFVESEDLSKTPYIALIEAPIREDSVSDEKNKIFPPEGISTAPGSVEAQKVECSEPINITHITNQKYESVSDVDDHASIAKRELEGVVAYNEDAKQQLEISNVVFNKQILETVASQEITMSEKQSEFLAYKQVSEADKLPMEERELTKTAEDKDHELENFETSQNDQDKQMDINCLPVSQFLIDRIMKEEDDKSQITIQKEAVEDGCEGVDNMKQQGLDLSSYKDVRTEECISQSTTDVPIPKSCDAQEFAYNIDGEPNRNLSSLDAVETLVEDEKKEVFRSERLIYIVPKEDEKHALMEKSETQRELEHEELTGLGLMTSEKSAGAAEVTEQMETLNDNEALITNSDTPSLAKINNNKILQKEGCREFVEAKETQPSTKMHGEVTTEGHPPETKVVIEMKNFTGTDQTLVNTREPSRPVFQANQALGDALPTEGKEVKTQVDDKHNGITDARMDSIVEGPIEGANLPDSSKAHPLDSEKESKDYDIQKTENILEEKSVAIDRFELKKEATGMQVDEEKSDEEDGNDEEEHEIDNSGTDAPVTVETRDEPKSAHKKSHNILSGVKSKVKHSIAKVKKVITGKSSHSKTMPPK